MAPQSNSGARLRSQPTEQFAGLLVGWVAFQGTLECGAGGGVIARMLAKAPGQRSPDVLSALAALKAQLKS